MADNRTSEQRRKIMQAVKTRDTRPEWIVRRMLHAAGYRYRLHVGNLPGTPDIVFPSRRKVIFIHGCFWHGHNCRIGKPPKSRLDYWRKKLDSNKNRDAIQQGQLHALGWDILVVWQCEIVESAALQSRLWIFLGPPKRRSTHPAEAARI